MLQSTQFIQNPTHLSNKHTISSSILKQCSNNNSQNESQCRKVWGDPDAAALPMRKLVPCDSILKQCNKNKITRRELSIFTKSSLLLFLTSQTLNPNTPLKAQASEETLTLTLTPPNVGSLCNDEQTLTTGQAFLDISIDGEPVGRLIIQLHDKNAPLGASRFRDIVSGKAGISYRRKEFTKILPNYIQHAGVKSYGVDAEFAKRQGRDFSTNVDDGLLGEWERLNNNEEKCGRKVKNVVGSVSIIVRDPSRPPPKMKLVARKGKLEMDEEVVGVGPNGTEFTVALKDSPELDSSALVVGRVVEGMDVVERISKVKTVQENTTSPYFRVAKLIGDKRAVVAERGFNRPYSKIIVTNCGLLE